VALNAANEVAVEAFLDGVIPFTSIPIIIAAALDDVEGRGVAAPATLDDVRAVDAAARELSRTHAGEVQSKQ